LGGKAASEEVTGDDAVHVDRLEPVGKEADLAGSLFAERDVHLSDGKVLLIPGSLPVTDKIDSHRRDFTDAPFRLSGRGE
jgi:hypothetical protein